MSGRTPDQDTLTLRYERGEITHGEFNERALEMGMVWEDVDAVARDVWISANELSRAA